MATKLVLHMEHRLFYIYEMVFADTKYIMAGGKKWIK
jgi:hypothetical protein